MERALTVLAESSQLVQLKFKLRQRNGKMHNICIAVCCKLEESEARHIFISPWMTNNHTDWTSTFLKYRAIQSKSCVNEFL